MILKDEDTINYYGGAAAITAALVTAVLSLLKFTYELGKEIGEFIKENYLNNTN